MYFQITYNKRKEKLETAILKNILKNTFQETIIL